MGVIKKEGGNRGRKPIAQGVVRPSWSRRGDDQTVSLSVEQRGEDDKLTSHRLDPSASEAIEAAIYTARALTADSTKPIHHKDQRTDAEVLRALADAIDAGSKFV